MNKKKEEVINEKIMPKLAELKTICHNEDIPIFILICTDEPTAKKDAKYYADMVSPAILGQEPKNYFGKFIQVLNDFKTVPHVNNDYDIDEFSIPEEYRFGQVGAEEDEEAETDE